MPITICRLRLKLLPRNDYNHNDGPPSPSSHDAAEHGSKANANDNNAALKKYHRLKLNLICNENTTFAGLARILIEDHLLDGYLLRILANKFCARSDRSSSDCTSNRRPHDNQIYVLHYGDNRDHRDNNGDDSTPTIPTIIHPQWSPREKNNKAEAFNSLADMEQHFLVRMVPSSHFYNSSHSSRSFHSSQSSYHSDDLPELLQRHRVLALLREKQIIEHSALDATNDNDDDDDVAHNNNNKNCGLRPRNMESIDIVMVAEPVPAVPGPTVSIDSNISSKANILIAWEDDKKRGGAIGKYCLLSSILPKNNLPKGDNTVSDMKNNTLKPTPDDDYNNTTATKYINGTKSHSKKEIHVHPLQSFLIPNFIPNTIHTNNFEKTAEEAEETKDDEQIKKEEGSNTNILLHAFLTITTLIFSGIDQPGGIKLSVDDPWGAGHPLLNVERPAVLRQYFGRTLVLDESKRDEGHRKNASSGGRLGDYDDEVDNVWRSCYGSGTGVNSVGVYPGHFVTREMTPSMKIVAHEIHEFLQKRLQTDPTVQVEPFNHATILFYYLKNSDEEKRRNKNDQHKRNLLQFHTDNVFSHDGDFQHNQNSQMENTVTAVLTLGDDRELHFREQILVTNEKTKKMRWSIDHPLSRRMSFTLSNGSLFVLHPRDEVPIPQLIQVNNNNGQMIKTTDGDELKIKYILSRSRFQHGGIVFNSPHKISVALVFRSVAQRGKFHRVSGKLFQDRKSAHPASRSPTQHHCFQSRDSILNQFRDSSRLIKADCRLKNLWNSACIRHFDYDMNKIDPIW